MENNDRATEELLRFFNRAPEALPLYLALEKRVLEALPETALRVSKTQISLKNRYGFACVSLPGGRIKGSGKGSLIVTFGLPYRLSNPRVFSAVEPYPKRWTHHVLLSSPEEIDVELMGWITEADQFARNK